MDAGTFSFCGGGGVLDTACGLPGLGGVAFLDLGGRGFTLGSTISLTCKASSGAGGFGLLHHENNRLT